MHEEQKVSADGVAAWVAELRELGDGVFVEMLLDCSVKSARGEHPPASVAQGQKKGRGKRRILAPAVRNPLLRSSRGDHQMSGLLKVATLR